MNNNEYYDIHKTNSPPSHPSLKQKDLSLEQARQWLLLSRRKSQEMEFFYQYWSKTCSIISFDFHPPHNPIKNLPTILQAALRNIFALIVQERERRQHQELSTGESAFDWPEYRWAELLKYKPTNSMSALTRWMLPSSTFVCHETILLKACYKW